MTQPGMLDLTTQALLIMLKVSLPPILVASAAGLLVSFFQAVTQLQEQTFSFAIKLMCVMLTIMVTAAWLGGELLHFTNNVFQTFWQQVL